MKLQEWLNKSFRVTSVNGDEVLFSCPKCAGPLYFNLRKKIGYCHRASCHFSPTIKELNKYSRLYKDPANLTSEVVEPKVIPEIKLPDSAKPLLELIDGQLVTFYEDVVNAVVGRGVTPESQHKFNLHLDSSRIYIPVYVDGKLVNYVGRAYPWDRTDVKRYSYCTGASTRDYLFNWNQVKLWSDLVLVENTFNGIWLGQHCHATSNFGSDLSKTQVELLSKSRVKNVVILWDEGAEKSAGRARDRLMTVGIQATVLKITGQPDNHKIDELLPWIDYALQNSRERAIIDTTP